MKITVLNIAGFLTLVSCQLAQYHAHHWVSDGPYHYTGPYGGGQYLQQEKFPTNSTPLFSYETPYKKVDTNKEVADMFSNGIEAKGKEDVFDLLSSSPVVNTV